MYRTTGGLLILLALAPPLQALDKPKQPTPAQQYQALTKEYQDAMNAFSKAYGEAKSQEDRQKIIKEMYPDATKYTGKFLELARKNPKDAVAVDALVWVVNYDRGSGPDSKRGKALEQLLRDHVKSDKISTVLQSLRYAQNKNSEKFLRAVLEKNKHREIQGKACFALAQYLKNLTTVVGDLKANTNIARYEAMIGKEYLKELADRDLKAMNKEVEKLFVRVVDKYGDIKAPYQGTLADQAKGELFEIRHLSIGKTVPDIEAEDLDGTKFKLSDYRGKVVLLDFWGNW